LIFKDLYDIIKMNNNIRVIKMDNRAIIPSKAHKSDIGYDLTVIDVCKKFSKSTTLYETGIAVQPPSGYYIEVIPRSSLSKTGHIMANSLGIIDPEYTGTIKIPLTKLDNDMPNLKVPFCKFQLVLRKAHQSDVEEVSTFEQTKRGSGGFGSTG
jgi:dUTP pyrophosphatase